MTNKEFRFRMPSHLTTFDICEEDGITLKKDFTEELKKGKEQTYKMELKKDMKDYIMFLDGITLKKDFTEELKKGKEQTYKKQTEKETKEYVSPNKYCVCRGEKFSNPECDVHKF